MTRGELTGYNSSYFPGDFIEDIRFYWSMEGRPCKALPSRYRTPDYRALGPERTKYYLWWRTRVRGGVLDMADEGYAWLYCREVIDMGGDPDQVIAQLRAFEDLCSGDFRMQYLVEGVSDEYALYVGRPPSGLRLRGFKLREAANAADLGTYPIRMTDGPPSLPFDWYRFTVEIDYQQMREIVYLSLRGIDEITRSHGVPLVEEIGCEFGTMRLVPLSRFGKRGVTVDLPTLDLNEVHIEGLAEAIARQAVRFVTDGERAPRVPKVLKDEYRRVVAAAVDAVIGGEPFDPASFRTCPPGEGYWEDSRMLSGSGGEEERPVLVRMSRTPMVRPAMTLEDLESHRGDPPDPAAEYVPSGTRMASYSTMGPSQTAYYVKWRAGIRAGQYGYVDEGYMWLFLTELVNLETDPAETRGILDGIRAAYAGQETEAVKDVVRSHAVVNGYDVPPGYALYQAMKVQAYQKLASDPIGAFDMDTIRQFTPYGDRYVQLSPGIYEEAFTEAIRAADACLLRSTGKRIVDRGVTKVRVETIPVYRSIWLERPRTVNVPYRNVAGSSRVSAIIDDVFRLTIREVNLRLDRSGPVVPKGMRSDVAAAVREAVGAYMDRREGRERRLRAAELASSMTFDSEAIRRAEEDLRAVTGMMANGEDAPEDDEPEASAVEAEPPAEPPAEPAEGWAGLAASLDPVERAYLRELLAGGDGSSALAGTGLRPVQVESSINSKAMDAIGDAIMEDGSLYEEYAEDLGRALRWRRYRGAPWSR